MIDDYQIFLFDFDGLLVNTEWLHREAYVRLCGRYGHTLAWDFRKYCRAAHRKAPKDAILALFPDLARFSWDDLYDEKCEIYSSLIREGHARLMSGAEKLLTLLEIREAKRAVVTNSRKEHLDIIRSQIPLLNSIPTWVTRESYSQAKPHPECYLKAIEMLAEPADKIIGFEDTPRGLEALCQTRAQPVIVCDEDYPLLDEALLKNKGVIHLTSLQLACSQPMQPADTAPQL